MNYRIKALRYFISALAVSAACSLVAFAQAASGNPPASSARTQAPRETPKDRITILVAEWSRAKLGTQEYIEAMPEDGTGFKPTPQVRSFAEQMLHLAGGNYMFAAAAAGKENPWDFTKGKDPVNVAEFKQSKATLLKFVMESYDFAINAVKGLTSSQLDETVQLFSMKMPRHLILTKGIEHHAHHRGQTTIYLRLKGITPPSERLF
jgi:uncharacterized damage-inducible protein DinB